MFAGGVFLSLRHEIRQDAHEAAEELVERLAATDALLRKFPRPVGDIARVCGLDVAPSPKDIDLDHSCIAYRTILVTTDRKSWQRRLSIGHEIAHHYLDLRVVGNSVVEQECTAFAAGLLMPKQEVTGMMAMLAGDGQRNPEEWAEAEYRWGVMTRGVKYFGVGYKALLVAMGDYGLVTGVEPWHAVWRAREMMDSYYDRWNALKGVSGSSD